MDVAATNKDEKSEALILMGMEQCMDDLDVSTLVVSWRTGKRNAESDTEMMAVKTMRALRLRYSTARLVTRSRAMSPGMSLRDEEGSGFKEAERWAGRIECSYQRPLRAMTEHSTFSRCALENAAARLREGGAHNT